MAITFDGATKRIALDSASVSAAEIWSRWVDWHEANPQWPLAFQQVGGNALGGGLFIPPYFFLQSGWRVRPMEASHTLVITGNLFVEGGGIPVVPTLGTYNVSAQYTVPVQAQGIATGGGTGPTSAEIADAVSDIEIYPGIPLRDALRILSAVAAGKTVITDLGGGDATVVFRGLDDTNNMVVADMVGSERDSVVLDP